MNTAPYQHRRWGVLALQGALALILALGALVGIGPSSVYAFPDPVMLFYVTLPEADGLTVLNAINTDAVAPMYTYFSIAISVDNTYVYYDQWEDGYAGDMANPTAAEVYNATTNPAGVQIWGNGLAADGCAPNINGVAFTCTDGADVLYAGNVIIPYNAVTLPRVAAAQWYALDQFGTAVYNANNGNQNWSTDWVEHGEYATGNFRDVFSTQSYTRNDGSINWAAGWDEENDGTDSATTGTIYVTGGFPTPAGANLLRFREGSVANDAIRRTADTSAYTSATLSFTLNGNGIDASGDGISVQVSADGGSSWATLATYNTDPNGVTQTFDISGYMATNTTIRFIMVGGLETDTGDGETWDIDNVDITVSSTAEVTSPTAGDIQIIGGALQLTATEPDDSITRGVNLSTGGACATLGFTLGQSGIDANEDRLRLEVSPNGGVSYTGVATYTSAADAGAKSYDISALATAATRVRFRSLDQLETGEYWTIDDVRVDWNCYLPTVFDAKDKIGATASIAMARATWASGSGTLNAFAHEMYATSEWGTYYEAPVGTNTTTNAGEMFQYSGLSIMASQNNTTVQIDADANGSYETTVTLQEGGSYLVAGTRQGAAVLADKPVQVVLVTGDIDSNYASRDMNLLPVSEFGSSYWSPVGVLNTTAYPARLFLYNPSTNGSIYITCERYGVANTTVGPVAARGVATIDLVANQGARCFASTSGGTPTTDPIFAIGTVDSTNTAYDWSFTLYPDEYLTTEALIGLGLGKDPTNTTSTENGSPLWVTAACSTGSTYVYVDWNNDGVADGVDTNGDDIAEAGSQNGILVSRLQSVRLFEPGADAEPYDQSGALVWSRTTAAMGDYDNPAAVAGCTIALAWGEDPGNATAGSPGLDVGTSVPPLRRIEGAKRLTLATDTDPVGYLNVGDIAYYIISVRNTGVFDVPDVYVYDTVPDNTQYVPDSTEWNTTGADPWTPIPDDGIDDGYPLDVDGGIYLGTLPVGGTFYVRFRIELMSGDYEDITNCDTAYTGAGDFTRCVTRAVATRDWGDLPESYGTSAAADGPRHSYSGLALGTIFDIDVGGSPTTGADGDDGATSDDEDGITNLATGQDWYNGNGAFGVTVAGGSGCLNMWMDFTNDAGVTLVTDGNFTRLAGGYDTYTIGGSYSEHVIQNMLLTAGTHTLSMTGLVPAGLNAGATTSYYFRFRLSPPDDTGACSAAISPTGYVVGGEVEDYLFSLGYPTASALSPFTASDGWRMITLRWITVSEDENLGFNLYRAESSDGSGRIQINPNLIPVQEPGSTAGALYEYYDTDVVPGVYYFYWLERMDVNTINSEYGPASAQASPYGITLPFMVYRR